MSVFLETNHLFLVNPEGGVESVDKMAAAGFRAIFCNVLDFEPWQWETVRQRARNEGIACGPWLRTIDANFAWDVTKLERLIAIADDWDEPFIVNSEKELDWSGAELTTVIADMVGDRDAAISVEAWPFASVDWTPVSHMPVLPQIFPQEVEVAKDPEACRAAWFAAGMRCCVFTFGSYWDQSPDQFDRLTPYGVYTADNCGDDFAAWSELGTHEPCSGSASTPEPEPPEPPTEEVPDVTAHISDEEAREGIVYAARASIQNYENYKPLGRVQVCQRIASAGNTDPKWNSCREQVVAALDEAGVPK